MRTTRTLSSFARAALYGGIGNETPSGVEYDELASRRVRKDPAPKMEINKPEVELGSSESLARGQEQAVPITD